MLDMRTELSGRYFAAENLIFRSIMLSKQHHHLPGVAP